MVHLFFFFLSVDSLFLFVLLGEQFIKGSIGVEKNLMKAILWWRIAAVKGHKRAQTNLGILFAKGIGVKRNDEEAVAFFKLSATQDDEKAQYSLGFMYARGRGVPQSLDKAMHWWKKASKSCADAQFGLGMLYMMCGNESGVPKASKILLRQAADAGHKNAQLWCDAMFKRKTNWYREAIFWLNKTENFQDDEKAEAVLKTKKLTRIANASLSELVNSFYATMNVTGRV